MTRPQTSIKPILFLFDSDQPKAGNAYGHKFDSSFLRALKTVDRAKATHSLVLRGDLLLDSLCYKPSRVASQDWTRSNRSGQQTRSSTSQQSADMALFKLLIGDFCDSFQNQWHMLDLVQLPELLMQLHTFYCIFVPTFPSRYRTSADEHLRRHPWYLGAAEPDLSNPLHRELLVDSLIRDAFVEQGGLYMPLGFEGELDGDFYGAEKFSSQGIVALPMDEFSERAPLIPISDKLTARAMVTLTRLKNRRALNVHERLANQLASLETARKAPVEYDWDLKQLPNAPDEVEVQARKLTDYLLSQTHEKGKSKARFFEQELGITAEDWRYLRDQLMDALGKASFDDVRVDAYGIRFSVLLPVQGRNGQTATVNTAWIVRSKERATLVTAIPGPKGAVSHSALDASPVVPPELEGADRWQAIFDRAVQAGQEAAAECVPTPMKISGGELIMEGECGGAYVIVPDARKGFARWLKTNGHGVRHYHGGVSVYAETESQSVDRAKAYAEAFAKVLRRNGVECRVSTYLT